MKIIGTPLHAAHLLAGAALALGLVCCNALAGEGKKPLDVKATFRTICSYCHQDMGRKPGKAPQLMDSPRSDEFIFNRIKNGKPGQMAAFGATFSDDDIRRIIKFIRSLKPDEEPQNPS
ncbi:MAG TPA: cytochrome c [Burkholderiales bacterium]|nr:cytochrome c [Burkholderiales bacterium]